MFFELDEDLKGNGQNRAHSKIQNTSLNDNIATLSSVTYNSLDSQQSPMLSTSLMQTPSLLSTSLNLNGSIKNRENSLEVFYTAKGAHSNSLKKKRFRWESGSCSLLGQRNSNEDRLVVVDHLSLLSLDTPLKSEFSLLSTANSPTSYQHGYFAVYDGHAGSDAAVYLQKCLHIAIYNHPLFFSDVQRAIEETCFEIDREFLKICDEQSKVSGSTALGIFLRGTEMVLFNIGDSCAVLCTSGAPVRIYVHD